MKIATKLERMLGPGSYPYLAIQAGLLGVPNTGTTAGEYLNYREIAEVD